MDINVNGSGSDQNTYMMDGVITTNYGSGGAAQSGSYAGIRIPNPDSIQEFKVQTSQYDAAYGQNPGANVNVVTKSGTNQFHGSVWEFNRNNFFNANDFFYKNSERTEGLANKPPEVKQNQYGVTFGGPIKKDKLLFFGSYQGTRQLNGMGSNGFATGITSVGLTAFQRTGRSLCECARRQCRPRSSGPQSRGPRLQLQHVQGLSGMCVCRTVRLDDRHRRESSQPSDP